MVAIIIDDHILARNVNAVASTGVESTGPEHNSDVPQLALGAGYPIEMTTNCHQIHKLIG